MAQSIEVQSGNGKVLIAAALMSGAAALNAVDAVIVRMLADVHPLMIGFFRAVFGLLFILPWIIRRPAVLKSHYRFAHALRAGLKIAGLTCFFTAYALAPLADVMAINFLGPIFMALGAGLFLSERLGVQRICAVLAGFAGAMIIINPGQEGGFSPALLFALGGAALTAVVQLMLKSMSAHDSTDTLVSWNLILMVPLSLIPALFVWTAPNMIELGLLCLQGVLGAFNMTMVTRALALADASFLAPFDFLRLPVVALLAFLLFGEVAGIPTYVGAGVIFCATLIAAGGGWLGRLRVRSGSV